MLSAIPSLKVAVLSPIWPGAVAALRLRHAVCVAPSQSPSELLKLARDAEVVVVRSGVRLDYELLERAPQLRLIVRAGTGLEGIDCQRAAERGIRIIAVPQSAVSVAEHVFGLAIALGHEIARHDAALREGRWEKHSRHGKDLYGRRLGLLGFGRIGQRAAELGRAFGMSIIANDRSPSSPAKATSAARWGVSFVALDDLFASADVLSVQLPLDDATRWLVNARRLRLMKPDALLINVGRGGTVDEQALFMALSEGRLAGAALDVFESEPPGNHPLFSLGNFVGTPHVAAQTRESQERVGDAVVRIVNSFAAGEDWTVHGSLIA
jgi:D-3-phosphoglycerate dehydrogenase / 2-oxoglutarate reductase